jgi:hypothetical protein
MKDAFGRLRISKPYTLLDVTHTGVTNNVQETELIEGGATSTHQDDSGVMLSVTTTGDRVVRQSRARAICPPGKSILVLLTGVLNMQSNSINSASRLGYFDVSNGFFIEYSGGNIYVVMRTSVNGPTTDTKVIQSDWNGSSNITIELDKLNVFFFDLQCLGVGLVKFGTIVGGQPILLHMFSNGNIQYASLPTRYEMESTNGAGSMVSYSSSVISESGYMKPGCRLSANIGGTSISLIKDIRKPICTLRLKPNTLANVRLCDINILRLGRYDGMWELFIFRDVDATTVLTASNFISQSDHVEIDWDSTGVDITSATRVHSGYNSGDSSSPIWIDGKDVNSIISNNIVGISDLFVIAYTPISGNDSVRMSVSWKEFN